MPKGERTLKDAVQSEQQQQRSVLPPGLNHVIDSVSADLNKRLGKPVSSLHTGTGNSDLPSRCPERKCLDLSEAHPAEATVEENWDIPVLRTHGQARVLRL